MEFDKMPFISFDYAILEKSNNVAMVELQSDWKDLGSWKSIYDVNPKDENNNVFIGHVLDSGSKNSLVYSSSKLVATIGLEDTVVIETEDAILACKKDKAQDVKQIYETLKEQHDDTQMVHKTVYRPGGLYTVIAAGKGFQTKIIHVNKGQSFPFSRIVTEANIGLFCPAWQKLFWRAKTISCRQDTVLIYLFRQFIHFRIRLMKILKLLRFKRAIYYRKMILSDTKICTAEYNYFSERVNTHEPLALVVIMTLPCGFCSFRFSSFGGVFFF